MTCAKNDRTCLNARPSGLSAMPTHSLSITPTRPKMYPGVRKWGLRVLTAAFSSRTWTMSPLPNLYKCCLEMHSKILGAIKRLAKHHLPGQRLVYRNTQIVIKVPLLYGSAFHGYGSNRCSPSLIVAHGLVSRSWKPLNTSSELDRRSVYSVNKVRTRNGRKTRPCLNVWRYHNPHTDTPHLPSKARV